MSLCRRAFETFRRTLIRVRLAGMSSDITSSAPKKKALTTHRRKKGAKKQAPAPVWITSPEFDEARDRAETEWLTIQEFADDPRFGGTRDRSGPQHAVDANRCGLRQSRRTDTVQVRCRGGKFRPCTTYRYPLWRFEELVGFKVIRRPVPLAPPSTGPLERSVAFTSPTPQDEETPAATAPSRPRPPRDLLFIPPQFTPELETCGADSC
jgi:hypothetical protein